MTFNEDTRVKIPAILTLTRLGYDYISLKGRNDIAERKRIEKKDVILNKSIDTTRMKTSAFKVVLTCIGDYAYRYKIGI